MGDECENGYQRALDMFGFEKICVGFVIIHIKRYYFGWLGPEK